MFEGHDQAIQGIISARQLLGPERLRSAAERASAQHSLARVLINEGLIELPVLLAAVADHLDCDCAPRLPAELPAETVALLEGGLARTYGVVPLAGEGTSVV